MRIIKITVFLAAFLLFQIELIISQILLPLYGGSYSVWGACVVFFQVTLFLGYLYSHLLFSWFSRRQSQIIHLVLSFTPLFVFPGRSLHVHPFENHYSMALQIFGQLAVTIGMVFFILSSMSIVWQGWLQASDLPQSKNPYPLYAVSNWGSLGALLSYPFLVEAFLPLDTQVNLWRAGYFILLALQLILIVSLPAKDPGSPKPGEASASFETMEFVRWVVLSAVGVIMFLAVTNIITSEVLPMPLLWIIPLSIYLISFCLNFKRTPWCPGWITGNIEIFLGLSVLFYFFLLTEKVPFLLEMIFCWLILFIICMYSQNSLIMSKPQQDGKLTGFYLAISLGGALGGMFVSWAVPWLTTYYSEFLAGLLLLAMAMALGAKRQKLNLRDLRMMMYLVLLFVLWRIIFKNFNVFAVLYIVLTTKLICEELGKNRKALFYGLVLIMSVLPILTVIWSSDFYLFRQRNYYGILKIVEMSGARYLMHGGTLHGIQYLNEDQKLPEPLAYYHRDSPAGEVLSSPLFQFQRLGMVGLGAGSLVSYADEKQSIDFFEIDPAVIRIAQDKFSFLGHARAEINYFVGDARMTISGLENKKYDILVIDAFSGDAVPMHLLTKEAILQYRKVLKDSGLILFHISNRYLKLGPVLSQTAFSADGLAGFKAGPGLSSYKYPSQWLAVTWDQGTLDKLISELSWKKVVTDTLDWPKPWTDQHHSILPSLRLREMVVELVPLKYRNYLKF